jgi:pyocin large subunit-like protein
LKSIVLALFAALLLMAGGPGFRTERLLDQHYAKHGHEFGKITKAEYLHYAQELRDAPVGGPVLESRRRDRVITRYHRAKRWFGAYNSDGTIRTFFIPVRGEDYFRRQARR